MNAEGPVHNEPLSISIFLDDNEEPIATNKPRASFQLETSNIPDGEHVLRIRAVDAIGNVGIRCIPFVVANGPGITVTGLRAGSRIRGKVTLQINAFGADEPFDPVRAESRGPVPVWTWVFCAVIAAWSVWYGLEYFTTPREFAASPTFAQNPALVAANAPAVQRNVQTAAPVSNSAAVGSKNVAGFDYSSLGALVYSQRCSSCHGDAGAGIPSVFPALAGDSIVNGIDAGAHIRIVLHGLSRKTINGQQYAAQMPAFAAQLSDAEIAAVVDHERTSFGNHGPTITPAEVARAR